MTPPSAESRPEAPSGLELDVYSRRRYALEGFGERPDTEMEVVSRSCVELGDAMMAKLNRVRDLDAVGTGVDVSLRAVMLH